MANEQTKLQAELRTERRSGPVGRLRRAGFIPAAVNRIGGDTTLVKLNTHAFLMTMRAPDTQQTLVTLELEGTKIPVIIREIQHDVISELPIHIDFGEISLSETLRLALPVNIVGEAVGVSVDGGIMTQDLREVEVECLPTDVIESIDVDVSALQVLQSITVADLKLGDKFTILSNPEQVIVTIMAPVQEKAASEEESADEPEVIGQEATADTEGS